MAYYNAAENLLMEWSLTVDYMAGPADPLIHFPPLYPALLAPLHTVHAGVEYSVRFRNMLLFALYVRCAEMLVLGATDPAFQQ